MELLILIAVIGVCSGVALLLDIRICLFYNLFKIPCPGCGLTRSILAFLQLDFAKSIKYNLLGIPFVVFMFIYVVFFIFTKVKHKQVTLLTKKTKPFIIGIAILVFAISWICNLHNPLLY